MQESKDNLYISKVCNGDTEAFRYFIKEYKDMAFSIAVSVVKDDRVGEEIVQDAFTKAYCSLKKFNKESKFSTWFYRIVVNESLTALKKLKKEIIVFKAEYDNEIPDESSLVSLKLEERRHLINKALSQLPPNESLALSLFYLQEENLKEVREITGWSESNAKVILHRARKSMFAVLNQILKGNLVR